MRQLMTSSCKRSRSYRCPSRVRGSRRVPGKASNSANNDVDTRVVMITTSVSGRRALDLPQQLDAVHPGQDDVDEGRVGAGRVGRVRGGFGFSDPTNKYQQWNY